MLFFQKVVMLVGLDPTAPTVPKCQAVNTAIVETTHLLVFVIQDGLALYVTLRNAGICYITSSSDILLFK